jgi:threonine dehydrogenase-like Zn-dependent dehydrogenase
MRALVFDEQLRFVDTYPHPTPQPGEARIRVALAGICRTDLEVVRGYAGFRGVLGHEFVGVVDQVAPASLGDAWIGRRVVGEINIGCGTCDLCRRVGPNHCLVRQVPGIHGRDGAFADALCLPLANLHPVPESVPDRAAVFAEPLAAACQVLEQVSVRPSDRVLVVGDGKLGLLVAQVVALTGCRLKAVGHHPDKLAILARRGIATALERAVGDEQADVVVECTGHPEGLAAARRWVRPQGTVVLKSTYAGLVETDLSDLVVREVRLVGSRCGPFPPALRLLARGWVDVESLVTAEYALDEGLAALAHAGQRGVLKVLLRP